MRRMVLAALGLTAALAPTPAAAIDFGAFLVSVAGAAVGIAGGSALSAAGVGPAGQPGATFAAPAAPVEPSRRGAVTVRFTNAPAYQQRTPAIRTRKQAAQRTPRMASVTAKRSFARPERR